MQNVSDKSCRETQNAHFVFNNFFFENGAVFEIMWENIVKRGSPQLTIRRMFGTCWMPNKATNTQSECVMLIGFPPQHWLNERPLTFRRRNYFLLIWHILYIKCE